jgi:hypothetical protein
MQDATAYQILITISTEKLESMRRELVEIIRKNETQSMKEEFKDLRAIWVRVLCVTVGEQQVNRES